MEIDSDSGDEILPGDFECHIVDDESVILILTHPCTIYFCGVMDIQIIWGAAEVFGYFMGVNTKMETAYSPKGTSSIAIKTVNDEAIERKTKDFIPTDRLHILKPELVHRCRRNTTIAYLRRSSTDSLIKFLKKYISVSLFPHNAEFHLATETRIKCLLDTIETSYMHLVIPESWKSIENLIFPNPNSSQGIVPRIVICGGKNVGKSTLLRYQINRVISTRYNKVLVLDLDPGQSEFTIMGCVSAVVVDKAILGPNFTHMMRPVRWLYLGEINISNCLQRYTNYITDIVEFCRSNEEYCSMPWFVNTMGFSKGFGAQLISHVLKTVQPTDVIQIQCDQTRYNFSNDLTPEFINAVYSLLNSSELSNNYRLHKVQSATTNEMINRGLSPANKRDVATLSYFHQMLQPQHVYLTDPAPLKIDITNVELCVHENYFPRENIYNIMNGNLVALCYADTENKINCLGFGIVRSINMGNNELYANTPLSEEELTKINAIHVSSVLTLTTKVYELQSSYIDRHIPYLSTSMTSVLSRTIRRT